MHDVISRVAKRDNSSKYLVNGKTATFAAVAAELDLRGIDLKNNRFLILQGEVEAISQMPPLAAKAGGTGLLEYLEEIIGSNVFVEPIAQSSADYDKSEEARTQAKNRMRAAEKTREGLRGSRDEVVAYHQAQRDVMSLIPPDTAAHARQRESIEEESSAYATTPASRDC